MLFYLAEEIEMSRRLKDLQAKIEERRIQAKKLFDQKKEKHRRMKEKMKQRELILRQELEVSFHFIHIF